MQERIAVVDMRSGRMRSRNVPGGTLCHGPVVVTGGRVLVPGGSDGKGAVISLGRDLRGPARVVSRADVFTTSATEGRVWVARVGGGRRSTMSFRERTLGGETTAVARGSRVSGHPQGAVWEGLVLERSRGAGVWNPRSGRWTRRLDGDFVQAVHPRRIASCDDPCRKLSVVGPRGRLAIEVPPGAGPRRGTFSPDASLLALSSANGGIALVDVRARSFEFVPGARLGDYPALAWSRSGRWLFFATPGGRLMAYRPGANAPVELGPRFRGVVMSLAAV